jgi:hypothetical protein
MQISRGSAVAGAVSAVLAMAGAADAQIVVNGDFETGDFTGWTLFGETNLQGVWNGEPHNGLYSAFFGADTSSGISQNLNAPAGATLQVSFWLVNENGETPNSCSVTLDGQTVASVTDFTSLVYTQFTATITVANANPALVFTLSDPPYYLDIDDVQVTMAVRHCYANCDESTTFPVLNVGDFTCFIQKFAAGDDYANCDGSTTAPTLNVGDFTCFLQSFGAGCSAP